MHSQYLHSLTGIRLVFGQYTVPPLTSIFHHRPRNSSIKRLSSLLHAAKSTYNYSLILIGKPLYAEILWKFYLILQEKDEAQGSGGVSDIPAVLMVGSLVDLSLVFGIGHNSQDQSSVHLNDRLSINNQSCICAVFLC